MEEILEAEERLNIEAMISRDLKGATILEV